jgi:hypothetical protein
MVGAFARAAEYYDRSKNGWPSRLASLRSEAFLNFLLLEYTVSQRSERAYRVSQFSSQSFTFQMTELKGVSSVSAGNLLKWIEGHDFRNWN